MNDPVARLALHNLERAWDEAWYAHETRRLWAGEEIMKASVTCSFHPSNTGKAQERCAEPTSTLVVWVDHEGVKQGYPVCTEHVPAAKVVLGPFTSHDEIETITLCL